MSEEPTVDELYEVRNNFMLGGYQTAINEASSLHTASDALALEKDCFVFRSYLGQGNYQFVLDELRAEDTPSQPPELFALRLYAEFCAAQGDDEAQQAVLQKMNTLMSSARGSQLLLILIGSAYAKLRQYDEGLRYVIQTRSLEGRSLVVSFLVAMNRPDLAQKEWQQMQQMQDDAVATQLAQAMVLFGLGGESTEEAHLIYQELMEKFTPTPMLLNSAAACLMKMNRFADAERLLLESLEKDNKDGDTLLNLTACAFHTNRNADRFLRQVKSVASSHDGVQQRIAMELAFDEAVAQMKL